MLQKTGHYSHDVERTNYDLCKENVKNTGVVSAKTIDFLEKSALKIPIKLPFFYRLFFSEVCRINSRKIPLKSGGVFTNLSLKILQNLTFFFRDLHVSEALSQLNPSILTGQTLLALALCLIA